MSHHPLARRQAPGSRPFEAIRAPIRWMHYALAGDPNAGRRVPRRIKGDIYAAPTAAVRYRRPGWIQPDTPFGDAMGAYKEIGKNYGVCRPATGETNVF